LEFGFARLPLSVNLFEGSMERQFVFENRCHWTTVKRFKNSKNLILSIFFEKDERIILSLCLILYENDWNLEFLLDPLGDVGSQRAFFFWCIKHFVKTFHNDFVKKRLWINFFDKLWLDFLGANVQFAKGKCKICL
jgi:hypothetical protein